MFQLYYAVTTSDKCVISKNRSCWQALLDLDHMSTSTGWLHRKDCPAYNKAVANAKDSEASQGYDWS